MTYTGGTEATIGALIARAKADVRKARSRRRLPFARLRHTQNALAALIWASKLLDD